MIIKTTKPLRNPVASGSTISKLTSIQDPLNDPNFYLVGEWTQIGQDIDGEAAGDWSGYSVALSDDGTIVAIGAPRNDAGGHVRVYQRDANAPSGWTQIGDDIDGELGGDNSGWSLDLSSDGSVVAIGAPYNNVNGSGSGNVRVYQRDAGAPSGWTQIGGDIYGEAQDDWSSVVALSSNGTIVAIGAWGHDGAGNTWTVGHVRIYKNVSGQWQQIGSDIDGEALNDRSGESIALSSDGTIVAIGAPGSNSFTGSVRIYQRDTGAPSGWTKIGDDIDGEAGGDQSGISVALSSDGSVVAIGAYVNDGTANAAGHVRVYENVGGTWTKIGDDIDGEAEGDWSGTSVALSSDGSVVAIGAIFNDGTANNAGHVRVYQRDAGAPSGWTQIGGDIDGEAEEDYSGASVALSSDGSTVAIGATKNDGTANDAGHVRVYEYK